MEQVRTGQMIGRTLLVTGATAGIGRATAMGLARMGAHLAITGRDRGRAKDVAREIRTAGDQPIVESNGWAANSSAWFRPIL